jgi:ParB family chromosome partitioning protein
MARVDLKTLAPVVAGSGTDPGPQLRRPPATVPLEQVAANPVNPRQDLGDLTDLAASLREVGQLQPCVVVSRPAFLGLYPEREASIGGARFVVVAGSRRRTAAELAQLPTLDVVVRDELAGTRAKFFAAAVTENITRRDFDPVEEALAIQGLVAECGSGTAVAKLLGYTKGWVSQRLKLLELSDPMRDLVRAGEVPVRDARRLAKLPAAQQLPAWRHEQDARERAAEATDASAPGFTAVNPGGPGAVGPPAPSAVGPPAPEDAPADPGGGFTAVNPPAPHPGSTPDTDDAGDPGGATDPAGDDGRRFTAVNPPATTQPAFSIAAGADARAIARTLRTHLDLPVLAELVLILQR